MVASGRRGRTYSRRRRRRRERGETSYSDSWLFLFPSFHIPILWLFFSRSSHTRLFVSITYSNWLGPGPYTTTSP